MTETIRLYLRGHISLQDKEMEGSGVSKCHIDSDASVYTWRTIAHGHMRKHTNLDRTQTFLCCVTQLQMLNKPYLSPSENDNRAEKGVNKGVLWMGHQFWFWKATLSSVND